MFMSMFLENIIVSIPIASLQYTQELEYIFLPDVFTKTLYFWQFKLDCTFGWRSFDIPAIYPVSLKRLLVKYF